MLQIQLKIKALKIRNVLILILLEAFFVFAPVSADGKEKNMLELYRKGRITLKPILEISLDTLPEAVLAKSLTALLQLKNQIVITDSSTNDLKFLTLDGKFIRTVGRTGKGPADLLCPNRLCLSKNRIIIYENYNRRFSYFTSGGDFIKIVPSDIRGTVRDIKSLSDGRVIVDVISGEPEKDSKDFSEIHSLELYSSEMVHIKTLHFQVEDRYKILIGPKPIPVAKPFSPMLTWDIIRGDKLVAGFSDKYEFFIMDIQTGIKKTINRETPNEEVTETDKKEHFNSKFNNDKGLIERGASKFYRNNAEFPRYKPAYQRIFTDWEGNILVFIYNQPNQSGLPGSANRFDVYDKNGTFIHRINLSEGVQTLFLTFIAKDEFWSIAEDDNADTRFVKYKIM